MAVSVVTRCRHDAMRPNGVHAWVASDNDNKEEKQNNIAIGNNARYAVLVLGKTGLGKSSLIKTMTNNDNIEVSGATTACTTDTGFYLDGNGILWIDTRGGMDINQNSDRIFRNIKKACYDHDVNKIKFIWCIDSNQRTDSEYETQARSINSYSQGLCNQRDIWSSVLIVEKNGTLESTCDQAIAAVKRILNNNNNNVNVNCQCIGFKCIDWIKFTLNDTNPNHALSNGEKSKLQRELLYYNTALSMSNNNVETMERDYGFVSERSVKQKINNKLGHCSVYNVQYNIQKCLYCGIIGDSTFETRLCHTRQEFYHIRGNSVHLSVQRVHTANVSKRVTMWKTNLSKPKNWFKIAGRGFDNTKVSYRYDCCNQDANSQGCKLKCTKCQAIGTDQITGGCTTLCANCNNNIDTEIGCLVRCEQCHRSWGQSHQ